MSDPPTGRMFRKDEVEGRIVIETSGNGLGKAKDIAFGLDGRVVLIVQANENSETEIPMDRVVGVGEYIVVRRDMAEPSGAPPTPPTVPQPGRQAAPPSPSPPAPTTATTVPTMTVGTCRVCGATLKPGARFCTKCGTPV